MYIYIYKYTSTHKHTKMEQKHTQIVVLSHKPKSHNEKTKPSEETKI